MRHPLTESFLRCQHGFTGAEKALLICIGLAIISAAGYLVSLGSNQAASDAARTLRERSGGTGMGQVVQPLHAAGVVNTPAAPMPRPDQASAAPTITAADLQRIVPRLPAAKAALYAQKITEALPEYGITTKQRAAAFLGQIAEETDGFNTLEEYASGAEYNGRCKDLGNCQPGDGERYKGRGAIQLTGRANYAAAGQAFGLDLVGHPEQAASPDVAFRIAGWYWENHGLNQLADQGDFRGITRRINGGYNGEATRELYWGRARAALGI